MADFLPKGTICGDDSFTMLPKVDTVTTKTNLGLNLTKFGDMMDKNETEKLELDDISAKTLLLILIMTVMVYIKMFTINLKISTCTSFVTSGWVP